MPKSLEILELFNQKEICQITLMSFVEDFRVSPFQSLGKDDLLKTQEALYFLKSHGFSSITEMSADLSPILYSKMLKAYIVPEITQSFLQFMEFLPTLIIQLNPSFLILAGYYPKTESGYSLSDILEEEVDQKYFLSEKQVKSLTTGMQKSQEHSNIQDTQAEITEE